MGAAIVDLRNLGYGALDPLLREEIDEWSRSLGWDYSKNAGLVRKYTDERNLAGCALLDGGEVAGYGYTVFENRVGLIGDLYLRAHWRSSGDWDVRMFRMLLDDLIAAGAARIESQLMLPDAAFAEAIRRERFVRTFERLLMILDASSPPAAAPAWQEGRFQFAAWGDHYRDPVANMIALAYQGHVDSRISAQYQTFSGVRRFLSDAFQYPGCGSFFQPGSFTAFDKQSGMLSGAVLTSLVAPGVGHIVQLCVAPHAKGAGLGTELLRRAVAAMSDAGVTTVSLTVTAANTDAVRLYGRAGFIAIRRFFAYLWESY